MKEFKMDQIYQLAKADPLVSMYLPEQTEQSKAKERIYCPRQFLFNSKSRSPFLYHFWSLVLNTLKPGYFDQQIKEAYELRKDQFVANSNKCIDIDEQMLKLIMNSNRAQ